MKKGDAFRAYDQLQVLVNNSECPCCKEWWSADDTFYGNWYDEFSQAKDFKWIVKDGVFCE